jgi:pyruvate dehydrogenase E2 component (dihydrolipoamide acetyltransferase)
MATIIDMPKLSDTMTVGTLVNWLKKEGDAVSSGDQIAEIETDKATMEMEDFEDGVLIKQFVAAGEEVAVGEPICAIGKEGEKVEAPEKEAPAEKPSDKSEKKEEEAPKEEKEEEEKPASEGADQDAEPTEKKEPAKKATPPPLPATTKTTPAPKGERIRISPLARKLATELGVNPGSVKGSGPEGRIVRADVEAASKAPKTAGASAPTGGNFVGTSDQPIQDEATIKVSKMRATIARRLVEAKSQIPHFYLEVEIDAGPMLALRQQIREALGDAGKISVNDMILKACAHAIRKVPAVNCSWNGDSIKQYPGAHISFAVAIDDGLITPVVFDAHAKTVFQIATEARELAGRAKAGKLKPNEFTGGTFCVSNLGMLGINRFSAIINPPNGAILAVGTTVRKPVVNERGDIVPGDRLALTLSCDHRVVDGAVGAEFLAALRDTLEKPAQILL